MSGEVKDPKLVLGVELGDDEEIYDSSELESDAGLEDGEEVEGEGEPDE